MHTTQRTCFRSSLPTTRPTPGRGASQPIRILDAGSLYDVKLAYPRKLTAAISGSIDNLFPSIKRASRQSWEVKRSTDTRIRREVVGQMLDYAADAVTYWPVTRIRSMFEDWHGNLNHDPDEVLSAFLQAEDARGLR